MRAAALTSAHIAPELLDAYADLDGAKREIIGHDEGPLLVIAGPGSGKTFCLVLRTVNLLLTGRAKPSELIVCTFTEKAAFELRDRIAEAARRVEYTGDLSELHVSTIHGLCNRILLEFRHHTPLGAGHETLDELTELLFLFDHFGDIVEGDSPYFGKWSTKWRAIEGMRDYFDKITEELVDPIALRACSDPFVAAIGAAYERYQAKLFERNRVDFAHLQALVHGLLADAAIGPAVAARFRYVLVDEYQDTNYVQEQVLTKLASATRNLCVVGDEDQSLYRFRGATVRNILEFPKSFPDCKRVDLTTNYRSHEKIVRAYDRWMASADWSNAAGPPFRFDKKIDPDPDGDFPDYPAVISIWGQNARDEGERFADLVATLKDKGVIEDYSQVALLLRSVRDQHSKPYLDALEKKGIPAFCPRARAYFDNDEVRLMVGCFALLCGYYEDGRGSLTGPALVALARYVDQCLVALAQYAAPHELGTTVLEFAREIEELKDGESLDLRPADYFYRLLALEPFRAYVKNENRARNLAVFSQLLNAFQNYYHYTVVTARNREYLRFHLFNSFLRLLHDGGINEYEDPDQPFPKGHVQVMTIHQAKGLEFPLVVVGSLDVAGSTAKQVDRDLGPFYHRPEFEPPGRITTFDRMRLHYVAFSRAEKLLVLTSDEQPKPWFAPIWDGLPQWPYVQREVLEAQRFKPKDRMPIKKCYSFTGDVKVYETCPRQYEFFRGYDFTPSRSAVIFFGLLVHQTIEEIHRLVLDGKLPELDQSRIHALFERTFALLAQADVRPIGQKAKEAAFRQVINYFSQNKEEMQRVIETEVDVSVEKDGYILTGKVDLLMGGDGKLEILDFKTSERVDDPELIAGYERQLCTYAHILERRHGKRPERLLLYWTAEQRKEDAVMEFPYRPELVDEAGRYFDEVVGRIQAADFRIVRVPERKVCKECDLRSLCAAEGLFEPFRREE
ncbi:MAG TPA: ATP-dependent DNA helicase [Gaiellaceae bacterium]|nr:ATP-dependent DNA helicase [Gaiellaceae bacterium]